MSGLVLTLAGAREIEAAWQDGKTVVLSDVVLGDGGDGNLPDTPDDMAAVTQLYGPFGSEPFSTAGSDEGMISGQVVIDCKKYPGKILRELGLRSRSGTLIAYGRYPDTYLPAQTDSIVKEVIITLVLTLTHAESVVVEIDPNRAIITQEAGDKRYLQRKKNLSDVEDKDETVENLGLKLTVDQAKNSVQRDGDTMTGELKIRGVNALRIFNEAFGLIFRRSEECLHLIPTSEGQGENGDTGPLRPFTINLRTGEISMSHKVSVGGGSQVHGALGIGVQNALGGNSIALGDSDTGFKQNGDGLLDIYANGQHIFRFQNGALQSNRAVNVSGQVIPSDYGNFDARYQSRTGGVQDVRLGSAIGIGRGGDAPSGHLLSGVDGGESVDWANARPVQVLINGVWRNVASL